MTDPAAHDPADIASRRKDYETAGLDLPDVVADPMAQWHRWYAEASESGCVEPNAFVLGTVDPAGWPHSRYLLVRGADERGFTFFTNYRSAKSDQLTSEPRASMLFTWLQLHRQVRVVGHVERVPEEESDEYFASRPRGSQVGAWSSPQSQPIPDREWLEQRVEQMAATFGDAEVARPAFWGGWLLRPVAYEFWQGRPSRLHDRLRYTLLGADDGSGGVAEGDSWEIERLAP
ncbi:MAG: pyridoxamine 5'-phosphate oxidase [Actinobacteria bacterium]|nr:pyridoxamine 5'-phosphate oxidase [Actinomycetota bacterium]